MMQKGYKIAFSHFIVSVSLNSSSSYFTFTWWKDNAISPHIQYSKTYIVLVTTGPSSYSPTLRPSQNIKINEPVVHISIRTKP